MRVWPTRRVDPATMRRSPRARTATALPPVRGSWDVEAGVAVDDAALRTVWVMADEGLDPLAWAVIVWLPVASPDVLNVARPPTSGAVPSSVDPSKKLTMPAVEPGPTTVATNVTT